MSKDRFKFRYWHEKQKKYIYTQCDCLAICNSCFHSTKTVPDVRGWYNTVLDQAYNDFELIPEQCTGLKDKNGNLIYEGDVVIGRKEIVVCEMIEYKDVVEYKDGAYFPFNCTGVYKPEKFEIIGNVHKQAEQKDNK